MTIKEIQDEVYYYIGKKISKQEAQEILYFYNFHKGKVGLDEIVSDYYSC